MGSMRTGLTAAGTLLIVLLVACGGDDQVATADGCAHVIDGSVEALADGSYRVAATVSSADTGWEKYADAWEVRTPDGAVLGVRVLAHPHETEQPFTRSLAPVEIPAEVSEVALYAQDSVEGFCGESLTIAVQR